MRKRTVSRNYFPFKSVLVKLPTLLSLTYVAVGLASESPQGLVSSDLEARNTVLVIPKIEQNYHGVALKDIPRLDIMAAVQRAVEWHPAIQRSVGQLNQQQEQVNVAKSGYYPQVTTGIRGGYRHSTGRNEEYLNLSASQMLYDFGKVSSRVEGEQFGVERSEAEVLRSVDALARDTAMAALEVQRYQDLLLIAREQVAAITDLWQLSKQRSDLGASTRSDEIQAQSRREAAMAFELQMSSQLDVAKKNLQMLVGAKQAPEVTGSLPVSAERACWVSVDSLNKVPEVLAADAQKSQALAQIKESDAAFMPTFSVDLGMDHYLKDRPRNGRERLDRTDYSVTLNMNVDLYQGGSTTARRKAAGYALQAADATKDEVLLSISRALEEAQMQSQSFKTRLSILDSRIDSIVETQKIYRQQYISLGTRSLLDLLNAEQETQQARMEHKNTLYDLQQLQVSCLYNTADMRKAFAINQLPSSY